MLVLLGGIDVSYYVNDVKIRSIRRDFPDNFFNVLFPVERDIDIIGGSQLRARRNIDAIDTMLLSAISEDYNFFPCAYHGGQYLDLLWPLQLPNVESSVIALQNRIATTIPSRLFPPKTNQMANPSRTMRPKILDMKRLRDQKMTTRMVA